jgi:hypothetical protein
LRILAAMRRSAIAVACASALLCGAPVLRARAESERVERRVAVDWSGVTDADVARCGLSRLRAGTIERLVEDGHAVVEQSGEGGVQVVVASADGALQIHVSAGAIVKEDAVALGADCDSTAALEVIARISELVGEVARAQRDATKEPPATESEPAAEVATPEAEAELASSRSGIEASIDASVRANPSPGVLFGGGVSVRARIGEAWETGGRVELAGNAPRGIAVLEGSLLWTAAYQPALPGVGLHLELGPLLHSGSSDQLSVLELDATLGAGVQLELGHLLAQLVLYARLRSFEHREGDEVAFETGRFGVILRIGAQLFGS